MGSERHLFLKSLEADGIEEIYVEPGQTLTAPVKEKNKVQTTSVKEELLALREKALKCMLCQELATTRTNVVFGAGNIKAKLMFVGEAPGRDEDEQGLPFVGRAGKLLTKIIEAMGITRNQVFIANTLKCRPPQNRTPLPNEVLNCQPFLLKQIELIKPDVICALGTSAAQILLKTGEPISRLRGKFVDFPENVGKSVKVMCTYHPAYLLRNPGEKRKVWEDVKKIKKELGI